MHNIVHNLQEWRMFFLQLHYNLSFWTWNIITTSTPKHTSFKAKSNSERPPYKSRVSTITFVKLLAWEPSTTCCNIKRIRSHFHPFTTYTWIKIKDLLSIVVTSSQDMEINRGFYIVRQVAYSTSSCIALAMLQLVAYV